MLLVLTPQPMNDLAAKKVNLLHLQFDGAISDVQVADGGLKLPSSPHGTARLALW